MAHPLRIRNVEPFEFAPRDISSLFNRLLGVSDVEPGTALAPYAVDVRETADNVLIEAELPGFKKEEIDLTIENHTLTLSAQRGEKEATGGAEGGQYLLRERRFTRFLRSFTLPATVDDGSVQANFADGILTITLAKRAETKPRKIAVA